MNERDRYLYVADKICDEVMWVQDLWFGKAIVMKGHMMMMKGDANGAIKLVEDNMEFLREIDKSLKKSGGDFMKLSPMAQCRYFLGIIMEEKALKLIAENAETDEILPFLVGKTLAGGRLSPGALHHFYTVFMRYPATSWAPDAGIRAGKVKKLLEEKYEATINITISDEQWEKVKEYQFREARLLFNQQQFENAVKNYIAVLNLFPEGETSVTALGELARCYVELKDDFFGDMVLRYIGERFNKDEALLRKAGDQVLRVANMYAERKMSGKETTVYNIFFEFFSAHPRAASTGPSGVGRHPFGCRVRASEQTAVRESPAAPGLKRPPGSGRGANRRAGRPARRG